MTAKCPKKDWLESIKKLFSDLKQQLESSFFTCLILYYVLNVFSVKALLSVSMLHYTLIVQPPLFQHLHLFQQSSQKPWELDVFPQLL